MNSDRPFVIALALSAGIYVLLIVAMLLADVLYTTPGSFWRALSSEPIQYAVRLSLLSSLVSTFLSLWVAAPTAYLLSRFRFPGKVWVDALLDVPIVLPPLVVGLSLLILFQTPPGRVVEAYLPVTYAIPSIILAQFTVSCAFAIRALRVAFDQLNPRQEQVALVLGCSRREAFWRVALPEAKSGLLAAAALAWARSLGEFGPVLIFSGATRMKTEVLPTSIFLELSMGNVEAAVAVSLLLVFAAIVVLVFLRWAGGAESIRSALG